MKYIFSVVFLCLAWISFTWPESIQYYPDLQCHDGFNESKLGHVILHNITDFCESEYAKNADCALKCFKSCMLIILEIIVGKEFVPESLMAHEFKNVLFDGNNNAAAEKISKNIVSNCTDELRDVVNQNLPCEEYYELYNCVERAWAC